MCAVVDLEKQKEFLKKHKGKTVTVYKAVRYDPIYGNITSPIYPHIWTPGLNKSNSYAKLQTLNHRNISKGIHTNLFRDNIANYGPNSIIMQLTAKIEDLICIDVTYDAVFKKVYLSKKEYERVLKCVK